MLERLFLFLLTAIHTNFELRDNMMEFCAFSQRMHILDSHHGLVDLLPRKHGETFVFKEPTLACDRLLFPSAQYVINTKSNLGHIFLVEQEKYKINQIYEEI